jgi:hypothetical protein
MQQRRSDNVFLLTLVDFLVQIIFFGLFVFVVYQAVLNRQAKRYDPKQVHDAIDAAGVSNIKELIDELSKLAPVRLKGFNESLGKQARPSDVKDAVEAIAQAGGAAGVSQSMSRLAKLEKGMDKPPCLSEVVNGQRETEILASAVGTASSISFTGSTPQLEALLSEIGVPYDRVRTMGLHEFTRTFAPILQKHPTCRYTIVLRETTRMIDARDAAGQIFYLKLRR